MWIFQREETADKFSLFRSRTFSRHETGYMSRLQRTRHRKEAVAVRILRLLVTILKILSMLKTVKRKGCQMNHNQMVKKKTNPVRKNGRIFFSKRKKRLPDDVQLHILITKARSLCKGKPYPKLKSSLCNLSASGYGCRVQKTLPVHVVWLAIPGYPVLSCCETQQAPLSQFLSEAVSGEVLIQIVPQQSVFLILWRLDSACIFYCKLETTISCCLCID